MRTKEELFWKVLNTAISLDIRRGHLKWSMTELARVSRVSRSLIYYYFGKSKLGLLEQAIEIIGSEFSGDTIKRKALWREGNLADTLIASRNLLANTPELASFYFLHRNKTTEMGKLIKKKEDVLKTKISNFFPKLTVIDREAMLAIILGTLFTQDLSDEGVRRALKPF